MMPRVGMKAGSGGAYSLGLTSNQGFIGSSNSNYTTARAGTGTFAVVPSTGAFYVGQKYEDSAHTVYESFFEFDTSVVAGTIVSAILKINVSGDNSSPDFTIEAYLRDFGTGLTSADWVAGASISGLTLLASLSTSGLVTGVRTLTSEAAFIGNINQSGMTRIMLASSRTRTGTQPPSTGFQQENVVITPTNTVLEITTS